MGGVSLLWNVDNNENGGHAGFCVPMHLTEWGLYFKGKQTIIDV